MSEYPPKESEPQSESIRCVRKRQPPKKLDDYDIRESSSPSNSEGSTGMSDTDEHSEREQALLDRITTWERVMSKMTKEEKTDTCIWTDKLNDAVIKKYFKVRRKLMSPKELACQYFWFGEDTFYDRWIDSSDVENILSFLRLATSCVDTKETDVFFPAGGRAANYLSQDEMSNAIQEAAQDNASFKDWKVLLESVRTVPFRGVAEKMLAGVRYWLTYLGHIMKKNPATTLECVFEELTRGFITIFGLLCVNGSTEQLQLPGQGKKCHPDLIFAAERSTPPYWGIVEVKRMSVDPTFSHFFKPPGKGIIKTGVEDPTESEADSPSFAVDACIPSKKRHVTYPEEVEGTSESKADSSLVVEGECIPSKKRRVTYFEEDSEVDGADLLPSSSGASALPAYIRDTADIFFSQLFGQMISLDCQQPSRKNRRMGIGVVGFRVFFLAFYAKPGVPFAKIPETKGAKTEVHIAGPLCILDAKDREDIARILLLLAVRRP